tara:strand:+ start:5246 stop:7585 length:2340 start_codon:yes stop_codon:yes gene_type:complete
MKGFITYPTAIATEDKTQVQLFGKLENGQSFVVIDYIKPHFYIKQSDLKKVEKYLSKYKTQSTKLTNFQGEKVIKIIAKTQQELSKLNRAIRKKIDTYEADIKPQQRFLMERDILTDIEIPTQESYESSEKVDRIYNSPKISPAKDFSPKLKIASIDIESSSQGDLYCIGLYTESFKKVFMVTSQKLNNVISCKSEEDCLEKFKSELIKQDPDIITGWNVIDFDLSLLKDLFMKNKIPFDIGRSNVMPRFRLETNFFRSSSVNVSGRQVLDALNFIRDPFIQEAPTIKHANFESYTLEDVSQALLKQGKLLKGKLRHVEIESLYQENSKTSHQRLADYNLLDCALVFRILEKTKVIDLAVERSQLTGLPLDRIGGSIAAFDSLYIRKAHEKNLVSPTMSFGNKEERIRGGYVSSLNPGIYNNVLVLDFKSLYPSIIKTFNIDPSSFLEKPIKDTITTPNKAHFKNQEGVLPEIITTLHEAREKAKKEKRELASYALKITMNSFFGVLASPNCRYFNLDIANAITHFGQFIIKLTAKEIEKANPKVKVIYSDTDSVFVDTNLGKAKANSLGLQIQSKINEFYKNYTKKNYKRESFLELEFEKQYLSLMIPKVRGKETAAKKRYAGLIETNGKETVEITGLEAIRGDWTQAAQEFQKELLLKVFKKQEVDKFIKEYIKKINSGALDEKLIYRKSIRKPLEEYVKTTPPHVKAARQLPKLDSKIIEYVITTEGPEPIQKLKHKIDYEHYIEKQIKPIANQILDLFDKNFEDVSAGSKQSTLF